MEHQPYVFISYSHADKSFARRLAGRLGEAGLQYFIDEEGIAWGEDIPDRIHAALRQCTHVVILISPGSERSSWVAYETGFARGGSKVLVPYLLHPEMRVPGFLSSKRYLVSTSDEAAFVQSLLMPKKRGRVSHMAEAAPVDTDVDTLLPLGKVEYWSGGPGVNRMRFTYSSRQNLGDDRAAQLRPADFALTPPPENVAPSVKDLAAHFYGLRKGTIASGRPDTREFGISFGYAHATVWVPVMRVPRMVEGHSYDSFDLTLGQQSLEAWLWSHGSSVFGADAPDDSEVLEMEYERPIGVGPLGLKNDVVAARLKAVAQASGFGDEFQVSSPHAFYDGDAGSWKLRWNYMAI